MRPLVPRGFRDRLFREAGERGRLSLALGEVFAGWGYMPVETPAVEEYATLEAGAGRSVEDKAFRLIDLDGRLLALRPEMTVPIARVAASRLAGFPGPHRLSYVAEVFREQASLRGEARQFTQAGVELVGASGPEADAEVALVMAEALQAAGLRGSTVAVGTVAVLRALLEASGAPEPWRAEVMRAAHERNLVALDRLAAAERLPGPVAQALRAVPRLHGGAEAIERCRAHARACGCAAVLDDLEVTWRLLESAGASGIARVDFGLMRSFDYYTGIVIEAYAPGLGVPLGGGGRYDGVLAVFDAPGPAAGFALGLERLHIALQEQGTTLPVRGLDAVLGGETPEAAFIAARRLRQAGWRVRIAFRASARSVLEEARAFYAAEALWAERSSAVVRLDRAGGESFPLPEEVPAPPTASWAAGQDGPAQADYEGGW